MDVQMRNALADLVVQGNEGPLGSHPGFDRERQLLSDGEQWLDQGVRKITQGLMVPFRYQQRVTGKEWPMVEEGHHVPVGEDDLGRCIAAGDLAEGAVFGRWHRSKGKGTEARLSTEVYDALVETAMLSA